MWAERSQPGISFVTSTVNISMLTSATWGHSSLLSELTIIVTSFLRTQKAPKRWQSWAKVPCWKILEVPGDFQSHNYHRNHHQRLHEILVIVLLMIALYNVQLIMIIIIILIVKTTRSKVVEDKPTRLTIVHVLFVKSDMYKNKDSGTLTLSRWWETQQSRCSQAEMSTASFLPGSN